MFSKRKGGRKGGSDKKVPFKLKKKIRERAKKKTDGAFGGWFIAANFLSILLRALDHKSLFEIRPP